MILHRSWFSFSSLPPEAAALWTLRLRRLPWPSRLLRISIRTRTQLSVLKSITTPYTQSNLEISYRCIYDNTTLYCGLPNFKIGCLNFQEMCLLWYFICRLVTFHPYDKDCWYHLLTFLKDVEIGLHYIWDK